VEKITRPTMTWHPAPESTGAAVVILPGGGFSKVVPDKEGTEAAEWLNRHGVSAFVLSYRTSPSAADGWRKPLQDAQRAMSLVRARCVDFHVRPNQLGLVGFSAGGQVAARLLCSSDRAYAAIDAVDELSFQPAFGVLVYPWNLYDPSSRSLVDGLKLPKTAPPMFLVHTDDDRSSSLGTTLLYVACKEQGIPAELHVYGQGGHGYGLREIPKSDIATWPSHAARWLEQRGVARP
jgi:acetyl esterase/lipase